MTRRGTTAASIGLEMKTFLGALAAALLGFGLAACGGGGGAAALSTALTGSSLSRESSTAAPATTEAAAATLSETRQGATVTETQTQTESRVVTAAPPVTTPATTAPASESTGTPGWVWALVGLGIALAIGAVVSLLRRGSAGSVPPSERHVRMAAAVSSWTSQGWSLVSESDDSAMLARDGERIRVWVDARGNVSSSALAKTQGSSS